MLSENATVFHGRYRLNKQLSKSAYLSVWTAEDEYGGPILIKAWPYRGDKPDDVQRALWDAELRHLFRLASLPEAEEHLVVLKDAGVDHKEQHFIMALTAPGLTPLESIVRDRAKCDWLRDIRTNVVRGELWRGLRGLAVGLTQLHGQQMLHRAISAASVLVDRVRGPSSMRLGGFEWTVRLGADFDIGGSPLPPPGNTGDSFESDWFQFGALTARLVAAADAPAYMEPVKRHEYVLSRVRDQKGLIDAERELLENLLTHNPEARLARGSEVLARIDSILALIDEPARRSEGAYFALLVLLGPQRQLTLSIIAEDENINALQLEAQRAFIENDLKTARVVRQQGSREMYILLGTRLAYTLTEHVLEGAQPTGAWDLAFCGSSAELRYSAGSDDQIAFDKFPIKVFTLSAFRKDDNVVRRNSVPWKSYLPKLDRTAAERERIERFHDFFRVTNQIELLMRDAEIFGYEIRTKNIVDGAEEIVIRETLRDRQLPEFTRMTEGLAEFLNRESENSRGELVYLGPEDALDIDRTVPLDEFWKVIDTNAHSGEVRVRRPQRSENTATPPRGFLRSFELFGQMSLIERRRRAIDKLKSHIYLLQALQRPDFVQLDSGETELPRSIDPTKLDFAKSSAMHSIWRTRPIFALQGPPGTGKTTLVANLLDQIFTDDPVAQVLVTAQAHAAVDVLLGKVSKEIFSDRAEGDRPLAVRLRRKKDDTERDPDYVEQVTSKMLERAVRELQNEPLRTPCQESWMKAAQEAAQALRRGDAEGQARDICELVMRSAGITYCTTTAGNLVELADSAQTFDWSIIEEAGKAHGFDLALPLRTGHRWLLIGDQNQLPPYRFHNFRQALLGLDEVFEALRRLPERAGGKLDSDLVLRWQRYTEDEKAQRRKLWLDWLPFFKKLYTMCFQARSANGENEEDAETGPPLLAQMLQQQHRMHPTIAELVSRAYYMGTVKSGTVDITGKPSERVVHPFVEPAGIAGRAIIWLDTPWVKHGGSGEQKGGRYTSKDEVDAILRLIAALKTPDESSLMRLATLSPYRRQVYELSQALRSTNLPSWVRQSEDRRKKKSPASTVDSFQGDQADVVIVSLVRNNEKKPGHGLGFLREAQRMNVLFSRAERLLVLVGSWDFFEYQLEGTPADHDQPLGQWRIAFDYLAECFSTGSAIKISVDSLPRIP